MRDKKGLTIFIVLFLVLFLFNNLYADNLSCLICHDALNGDFITQQGIRTSLHVDGEKFTTSVHGDLECTFCHLKYQDNPHQSFEQDLDEAIMSIAREIQKKSPIDPIAQAACSGCHSEIYQLVRESVHGVNIFEKRENDGALCLDCHGSPHEIVSTNNTETQASGLQSPVAYEQIAHTCGRCHEKKSVSLKYGFSTEIIKRYNESFHGKKYHLGGTNLPVCTTCHGFHDVRSQNDPEARVYGENRITLCSQCHKGANAKFVAAITHKPIGKDNPIPYYAERGLIILTLLVISGCALHILLDLYALIRDALRSRWRIIK